MMRKFGLWYSLDVLMIQELLGYVGFSSVDAAALRCLHQRIEDQVPAIIDVFYSQVATSVEARTILRNEIVVSRLRVSLHSWLLRVLTGPWDESYAVLRERIGHFHVRVELPQRFMLLAMSVIRTELHRAVESCIDCAVQRKACHLALARILDIDLALMLETYREDSAAAIRRLEEHQQQLNHRKLAKSEQRYRAVFECATIPAIILECDLGTILMNCAMEQLCGYSRARLLTKDDLQVLWHSDDQEDMHDALELALTQRSSVRTESRIVTKNNQTKLIDWRIALLLPLKDQVLCLLGTDITDQRLRDAQEGQAERLATLGTLAAGLAHEIRNPLNAAQLQLTLAERRLQRNQIDPEIASEPIRVVQGEIRRLAHLVNDFLSYARPAPLRLHVIDLCEVVRSILELLEPSAKAHCVNILFSSPDVVPVRADEEQLRQVIINIVQNAIEALVSADDKCVKIRVDRQGGYVKVSVIDNGPGILGEMDRQLYEPFVTTKEGGTGLGLAIVKRIIEQHGGTLGHGCRDGTTEFIVELPIDGPEEYELPIDGPDE